MGLDILDGIYFSISSWSLVVNISQFAVTVLDIGSLERKDCWKSSISLFMLDISALPNINTFLGTFLLIFGLKFREKVTASWSLNPGTTLHHSMKLGWVVRTRSRMFLVAPEILVGSVTNWSRKNSLHRSRKEAHFADSLAYGLTYRVFWGTLSGYTHIIWSLSHLRP